MVIPMRVAVVGGDGRFRPEIPGATEIRLFKSPGDGGNGEFRRLEAALKAGGLEQVLILTRWNSHSVTRRLRRICRLLRIPVRLVP